MGGVEQNGAKWNILTEIAAPPRTNRLLLATNRLSHNRPLLFRICTEPVPNMYRMCSVQCRYCRGCIIPPREAPGAGPEIPRRLDDVRRVG